ncbi:MAG TPA: protein kinase [Acetobacteraceae bacterium]|nr:protein kinase [Acetobacteraceae bacterium]
MPAEIGRYRVERLIGRGAMGVIYAAHDPVIDRKVAIKLIRTDLLSGDDRADFVARFQREARAAGRCVHPNIVAIYDFALHEGDPFLAMEYVEARHLGQVLAQAGRLPQPEAVAIIRQVLDALACAHAAGIVHRDVKPANILLLANGRVKMTDFGIARFDSAELTLDGAVVGTPSYMSPEQCRGEPVDARSDLFSAGVVLYEMLSGERPFPGRNFAEVAWRLLNEAPADIRVKLAAISPGLALTIERALAKPPADRFTSAAEMAAAMRGPPRERRPDEPTVVSHRPPEAAAGVAEATLTTIERKLARHVGPMAHRLVRNAARQAASLDELCDTLGQLIEPPEQRARFRQEILACQAEPPAPRHAVVAAEEARRAEQELVRYVGPIARILVKRAMRSAGTADQLWQLLAAHIPGDADRQAFLRHRG